MLGAVSLLLLLCSEPGIPIKGLIGPIKDIKTPGYQSVCFHDVRDDVKGNYDHDSMAVSTAQLYGYFAWMREHNFNVISVDDILAARRGERPLPERSVLLSFDDGLLSSYTKVFPMLKLFNYPAVIAPVVSWIEKPGDAVVKYAGKVIDHGEFMTWEQVKEMAEHPLVEIASHSYDLHRGVLGNPQGNFQPAAVTRIYDPLTGTYESDETYYKRIHRDLRLSVEIITQKTGIAPRSMVWPYGKHNRIAIDIAKDLGMPVTLVLDEAYTALGNEDRIKRHLIIQNPDLGAYAWGLQHAGSPPTHRFVTVDMDDLYHPDPDVYSKRFDQLVSRIFKLKISTVIIKAFSDDDGNGAADSVYFPNRHMPVKADLLNRVAWQVAKRGEAEVFIWLPLTAFDLPDGKGVYVKSRNSNDAGLLPRLSIFHEESRETIMQIYEDLGKVVGMEGVFMADDAFMTPEEDVSRSALDYYAKNWGMNGDLSGMFGNSGRHAQWMQKKAQAVVDFTMEIKYRMDYFRSPVRLIRSLPAEVVMNPGPGDWQAEIVPEYWRYYDYIALTNLPYFGKVDDQKEYLKGLVARSKIHDPKLRDTVVILHSWDEQNQPVPSGKLVGLMDYMKKQGLIHYGLDYDDFIGNRPELTTIRMGLSLDDFPYQ